MKILIDPIHTNDPQLCSCNYKMQTMMQAILEAREDVFFYYLIPDDENSTKWDIDYKWLIQDPRVKYIKIPVDIDRMREYARINSHLEDIFAYNGEYWDWDVLITARSTQIANIRTWATRRNRSWERCIIIDDEFPIMSFKPRANLPSIQTADMQALTGYMSAEKSLIFSYFSREQIIKTARKYFTPSNVRELDKKVVTANSRKFDKFELKNPKFIKDVSSGKKSFKCCYTQRLSGKVDRQDTVLELFEKQWIMHGGKDNIEFICTTNARVADAYQHIKHLNVKRCNRDEFWDTMRNEAALIFAASEDEDYPLSLIEPVVLGVPIIILDTPFVQPTFGKDYPFLCKSVPQMYTYIREFYHDYEGMYAKFAEWHKNSFTPMMEERNNDYFVPTVLETIAQHEEVLKEKYGGKTNEVVDLILEYAQVKGLTEFTMEEALKYLDEEGKLNHLFDVYKKDRLGLSFSIGTNFNSYRQMLMYSHGVKNNEKIGGLSLQPT